MDSPRPKRSDGAVTGWERRHLLPLLATTFPLVPLLLLTPRASDRSVLVMATVAVVAIATLQVHTLIRFVRGLICREQALRDAGIALAATTARSDVPRVALTTLLALARDDSARAWFLPHLPQGLVTCRGSDGSIVVLRSGDLLAIAADERDAPFVVDRDNELYEVLGVPTAHAVVAVPVSAHGRTRALGIISLRQPPRYDTMRGFATLADTLALALDRIDIGDVQAERRTERRVRSMVQHTSDIICLLDADLTICYVTPAVERVLGIDPLELVGQGWLDIVAEGDRDAARDLVLRAAGGRPAKSELHLCTTDGHECIAEVVVTEVDDEAHAGYALTCHDVTERRHLEGQLSHQAFHDGLTGLANRALFIDRVTHALSRNVRTDSTCAVLFLDLDDFKAVNDSLGHAAGDALLREVTSRIRLSLRDGDTPARLGGDEFAVLLEDVHETSAAAVAGRLIETLRMPYDLDGTEICPSASVGICLATAGDRSAHELLRKADLALYEAKGAGKSRWTLFAPQMHDASLDRLVLTGELRHGLQNGDIVVYYQPVVTLPDRRVVGFEAVPRWQHPSRGLLPAATFLSIAEDAGLVQELGRQVLGTALRDAARWQRSPGRSDLRIAVTLSGRQLQDPGLVALLAALLDEHQVPADTVVLELPESVLLPGEPAAKERIIKALSDLGVRLYVNDFGAAYSALRHLTRLPVDGMKLAPALLHDLQDAAGDNPLVRAIVDLAATLGLDAIAADAAPAGADEDLLSVGTGGASESAERDEGPETADAVAALLTSQGADARVSGPAR